MSLNIYVHLIFLIENALHLKADLLDHVVLRQGKVS